MICAGSHTPQESDEAIQYRAPFVLPWIVIEEVMAKQPESFVPFTAGPYGASLPNTAHINEALCMPVLCVLYAVLPTLILFLANCWGQGFACIL